MKTIRKRSLIVATALLGTFAFGTASTQAQTVNSRIGELKYENGYPSNETVEKLYDEMDFQRASQAYMWSFPAVSFASIKAGLFRDLGATFNDIVLYQDFLDTKSIYLTGNSTTIYAASQITLKDGPMVVEVPAGPTAGMFGDLWFITSGVGALGPDKGKGGKYLLVPPGYQGELPKEGYYITPLKTLDCNYFIRGIVIAGNVAGAADMIAASRVYPYSERANPKPNRVLRVSGKPINTDEPKGLAYWQLLSEVINNNPVQERDRFFMAMLKPLGIEKDKPFTPDERQKRILEEGARVGYAMSQANSYQSRLAGSRAYPGKNWANVFGDLNTTEGHQQEAEYYSQLDERLYYLYLGTWSAEAMNLPFPSKGQRYLESFKDKDGDWLDGSKSYKLRVPANPPADEFWSITVYDNLTRSMTMNKANNAAITSYDKITLNADGSADLYFGPKAPAGRESNWIDTSASKGWFVWFRFYGPREPFFNQTWQLPDFEKVN